MEYNNTENDESDASDKSADMVDAKNPRTKQPNKSSARSRKANDDKKKSYRRSWRAASPLRKLEIICLAAAAAGALGYLAVTFWGNLQTKWNFEAEHRPRLEFFREPALVGQFVCSVDGSAIRFRSGQMYVWVKNASSTGDATNAYIVGPQLNLVPDHKITDTNLTRAPEVTDETCAMDVAPQMKMFPLNRGRETIVNLKQSVGVQGFAPTKTVTLTFGEPQKPSHVVDNNSKINNNTTFQLYGPMCVYYLDEQRMRHGTCATYRFTKTDSGTDFACKDTPISGTFERMLWGWCEN